MKNLGNVMKCHEMSLRISWKKLCNASNSTVLPFQSRAHVFSVLYWSICNALDSQLPTLGRTGEHRPDHIQSKAQDAVWCKGSHMSDAVTRCCQKTKCNETQWKYNGNAMEMRCKLDWYLSDPWDASLADTPHRLLHFWPSTNIRESLKSCL